MIRISLEGARRARIAAQGLGRAHPTIEAALEESGLVRTLGGVEAYVALFARVAGLAAADVHAAVDRRDAQVVPAVRGCMYLVSRRQAPLCLRVAERMSSARDQREHDRAGIRPGELDDLGTAIVQTLRADPAGLTTDALRRALPPTAARSLGEIGKKIGLSSTLPPALRRLEFRGEVVRAVDGGRLDSERYRWRAVHDPAPYQGSDEWIDLLVRVAELYFRAAGIGSLAELTAWSGATRRDATAAAEKLALVPVEVEGERPDAWILEERRDLIEGAAGDRDAVESDPVALVPFEDNLLALQGGAASFVDSAHHDLSLALEDPDRPTRLSDARHVWGRTLVAAGKVVGFWEYHPDIAEVMTARFADLDETVQAKLDREARALGAFLTGQIGHGRSFSLDTDAELRRRAAVIATVSPGAAPPTKQVAAPKKQVAAPQKKKVTAPPNKKVAAPSTARKVAAPPNKKVAAPTARKVAASQKKKVTAPPKKKVTAPPKKKVTAPKVRHVVASPNKKVAAPPKKKVTAPKVRHVVASPNKKVVAAPPRARKVAAPPKKMAAPPKAKKARRG